jgi:hypothetical protein
MRALLLLAGISISLSGCAVVAVGAAAVSVTTSAVGLAYDVGKAGVNGAVAVGGAVGSAISDSAEPHNASAPSASQPQ